MNTLRQPLLREITTALLMAVLLLQSATAVAPGPAWWGSQSVADPYAIPDDFAVANVGQLKYLAAKAAAAMNAELPGGAGETINTMVAAWNAPAVPDVTRDNYLAINQGQLKQVAAPFYDRLGLPYPWAGSSGVRDDFQLVNLGQLKHVFSFELKFRTVGQGPVQIPAATLLAAQAQWDSLEFKPLGSDRENDLDGDGLSNLQEYLMDSLLYDPLDLDGDRILDSDEDASGGILSKLDFADAVRDHDGDGVMNFEEVLLGLELNTIPGSPSTRTDGLSDAEVLAWGLAAGTPLAPNTDAVRALWEDIDADWITDNVWDYYLYWLDEGDANSDGEPDGLTAFRADVANFVWQPPAIWRAAADDCDGDGMSDLWEYRFALDLRDGQDAWDDPDGDELVNQNEYQAGTNPRLADSDGDGFDDGMEYWQGGDPTNGTTGLPLVLTLVSGAQQSMFASSASAPLAVRVTQGGQPVLGAEVVFAVSSGGGVLRSGASNASAGTQVTLTTGSDGIASVAYLAGATEGSASVTAALAADSAQSVGFALNVAASATVPAGGGGPVRPWAEQTPSQTGSNAQGEDGMVLEVTAKSYMTSYLDGGVVSPPNTVTYTTGEVFAGSYNLNELRYYGYPQHVWNLPNDDNGTLGDRRSTVYGKFAEQAFGGSVSFSGPPQPLPQLKRGGKVSASADSFLIRETGSWERHDEGGTAIKVLLKAAPNGGRRSYLILHRRQTMVFSWTNWFKFGELETVGAGSVTFSGAGGSLNIDLAPGTLAQGIAKKVGNALEITPQRPEEDTFDTISLLPIEVVELSPKTKDEDNNDIAGSEKPNSGKPLTPFVEVDPNANKIAHRELKVLIGSALKDKKVTWTLESLPGATPATIRGQWDDSPTHKDRFEASTAYGANGFRKVSQSSGETTVGADGHTAIRVNVPPIGFNQVRIKIQIEGMSTPMDLIDMEVPGVVVIDPGHGGSGSKNGGSDPDHAECPKPPEGSGLTEKVMTLDYGTLLRTRLRKLRQDQKLNLKIFMTRDGDTNPSLAERAHKARDTGADILISLHFNGYDKKVRGTETFYDGTGNYNTAEDQALAGRVNAAVFGSLSANDAGAKNRGVKGQGLDVLSDDSLENSNSYHPIRAALLETEFIDVLEVDKTLNTNANASQVKQDIIDDLGDALIDDLRNNPQQ